MRKPRSSPFALASLIKLVRRVAGVDLQNSSKSITSLSSTSARDTIPSICESFRSVGQGRVWGALGSVAEVIKLSRDLEGAATARCRRSGAVGQQFGGAHTGGTVPPTHG